MTTHNELPKVCISILALLCMTACAHVEPGQEPNPDPWESWNRPVSSFNDAVDGVVLKPLATGYRTVMPDAGEEAVDRFFDNLAEVSNAVNNLLQGEPVEAAQSTGRLLLNSTLGIGGLFEVASSMGLRKGDVEDFGQTLAVWGVKSGPYLVLPILGPSTLRDTPALAADWYLDPVSHIEKDKVRSPLAAADLVQTRASFLDSEALISGDRYTFIRDAYLQRREYMIRDGAIDDDFDDFLDDDF